MADNEKINNLIKSLGETYDKVVNVYPQSKEEKGKAIEEFNLIVKKIFKNSHRFENFKEMRKNIKEMRKNIFKKT